jgi:hypothetical protein
VRIEKKMELMPQNRRGVGGFFFVAVSLVLFRHNGILARQERRLNWLWQRRGVVVVVVVVVEQRERD